MLTCREATALVARSDENRPDDETRLAVEAHLAECVSCREEALTQREVAALLRARPAVAPSPAFYAAVSARVRGEVSWFDLVEWRPWTFRLMPVAAGLFVVALFVGGLTTSTQPGAAATGPAALVDLSSGSGAESVLWDDGISSDQALLTVLTGRRPSSTGESGHE